jgi:PKHD-type hydroxylase
VKNVKTLKMLKVPIVIVPEFLTEAECFEIRAIFEATRDAHVIDKVTKEDGSLDYGARHCRRHIHEDSALAQKIYERFKPYDPWGFDVWEPKDNPKESGAIHIFEYEEGQYTGWHVDGVINDNELFPNNKMTIVIQLSEGISDDEFSIEYDGGLFNIFPPYLNDHITALDYKELKRGTLIAIPAFVVHEVSPVTAGVRYSCAMFISGPDFK